MSRSTLCRSSLRFGSVILRPSRLACLYLSPVLLAGLFLLPVSPAHAQFAPVKRGNKHGLPESFEPRAMQLLQQMVEAYRRLPALDQVTEFYTALMPLTPTGAPAPPPPAEEGDSSSTHRKAPGEEEQLPRRIHLVFAQPNRLYLEDEEQSDSGDPLVSRWVCDGKTYWSYLASQNWYSKEKAPAQPKDFVHLENVNMSSLELLMLMGVNLFADIKGQVDSARAVGTAIVRGVPTEEVVLQSTSPTEKTEVQVYIGKDDSLIRRMVIETTPLPKQSTNGPAKAGDPLDELLDQAPSHPVAVDTDTTAALIKTHFRYDNTVSVQPAIDGRTFAFVIPSGALLHEPITNAGKHAQEQVNAQIASILKSMNHTRAHKLHRLKY